MLACRWAGCFPLAFRFRRVRVNHAEHVRARDSLWQDGPRTRRHVHRAQRRAGPPSRPRIQDERFLLRHVQRHRRPGETRLHRARRGQRQVERADGIQGSQGARAPTTSPIPSLCALPLMQRWF